MYRGPSFGHHPVGGFYPSLAGIFPAQLCPPNNIVFSLRLRAVTLNVDELDGVYDETQPTSVSTLVENLHNTVTTDQLLLPPFPFEDPCPSSRPPKATGLLLEETPAVPNLIYETV